MSTVLYYAIPIFLLLILFEWWTFHKFGNENGKLLGYTFDDTRASLTMAAINGTIRLPWQLFVVFSYTALYELTPLRLSPSDWWVWVLLFLADDLAFYCFHRVSHESRVFWASHVVHHSSEHFNLSTALRQPVVIVTQLPFYLPLALVGFPPWMFLLAMTWSLIWQFWIHTERVGRLPGLLEAVLSTASNHRVHHGSNEQYLDKNYGGILVLWDRLFGTYEPEGERVRYGLTKNINTFNPVQVAFHEYIALWHDIQRAPDLRTKLALIFRAPGYQPTNMPNVESASRG